jgi:squalene-associated FAD-dependent desaturase
MTGTLHVIGAGLSGLSCALRATAAGRKVAVYEAAGRAGGRCRSFHDETIDRVIDNGNHMVMGANLATRAYLAEIGRAGATSEIAPASFPFLDLASGRHWEVRPSGGLLAGWIFLAGRRVPGTRAGDYLRDALRLARARGDATVADCVARTGPLFEALWQPICRAVMNTDATEASARLLWRVIAETLLKGEAASRPTVFPAGLSPTLIDPAIETLRRRGAVLRYQARLRGIEHYRGRAIGLHFVEGLMRLGADDAVVLAVPPEACAELWPDARPPRESRAIVNAHFRLDETVALPGGRPILGLLGGTAQWLFARGDVLSVTVSAADAIADVANHELAVELWSDCAKALGRNLGRTPPWRIIKEKRATFAQTPAAVAARPGPETALENLVLAGDWTDTGIPATIEGSVRSGAAAAERALAAMARAEADASAD